MPLATRYRQKAADGLITYDPAQAAAVEILSVLSNRLNGWEPRKARFLFGRPEPAPLGLYLYGGVGRGKSMLMDLFFETAPVARKRRVHFHAFMQEVHEAIARWRGMTPAQRKADPAFVKGTGDDPIAPVARQIADSAWLLCFDEFQVTDIADAMVLGRLFEQLLARQVVVVATSNRHPRDLYKNGLNRELFVPFIAMLEQALDLHALDGPRDWRLARLEAEPVYHTPLGPGAQAAMVRTWARLTQGAEPRPVSMAVQGRNWTVERAAAGCAWLDFDDICGQPLGPADYLALARQFDTVLLEDVPLMTPARRSEAARFRTLIDALYEARTKLVISAAAEPDRLYREGDQAFEFERTASRLYEMRSRDYLAAARVAADA
ncbi:MAG: cell division protein ZapE [Hyphomonadaceae bacterium]|nr:cell division protein ZapE [Hyphomonadaceae bacterium]